jgi:hypothetical protein
LHVVVLEVQPREKVKELDGQTRIECDVSGDLVTFIPTRDGECEGQLGLRRLICSVSSESGRIAGRIEVNPLGIPPDHVGDSGEVDVHRGVDGFANRRIMIERVDKSGGTTVLRLFKQ